MERVADLTGRASSPALGAPLDKTKDEQGTENPYKHLSNFECFDAIHAAAERFNVYVDSCGSRTESFRPV
jgi:hypothetical protein